jgi:hypothetical protein
MTERVLADLEFPADHIVRSCHPEIVRDQINPALKIKIKIKIKIMLW